MDTVLFKYFRDINTCEGEELLAEQIMWIQNEISTSGL